MEDVTIYTDGSCMGNPGKGGWGAVIIYEDGREEELSGYEAKTTNNRMEILAIIKAFEWLKEPSDIFLNTDSQYVINGITKWIYTWRRNNWQNASGQTVKNVDLWIRLHELRNRHKVNWQWVKGHNGDETNERADRLARGAIK